MAAVSRGVDRVLAKCEACIHAGNFYEAHQMFRTVYFRYEISWDFLSGLSVAPHKYSGLQKFEEAADLLYRGALILLQHRQYGSGADLSLLLLDVLNKSKTPITKDTLNQISHLFEKMDPECPERYPYLTKAINWSKKINKDHKRGHPDLHQRFGVIFWHERNYPQARYHYIHSTDGEGCAQMLLEFHTSQGYPSEVDMFITQAVLQGKLPVFTVLCEQYQVSINRDPNYKEVVPGPDRSDVFGVPPPQKTPQGLFGSLLQNVLGSAFGDDDEDGGFPDNSNQIGNSNIPNVNNRVLSSSPFPPSSSSTPTSTKPSKLEKALDLD